jgi:hypothetical protein
LLGHKTLKEYWNHSSIHPYGLEISDGNKLIPLICVLILWRIVFNYHQYKEEDHFFLVRK